MIKRNILSPLCMLILILLIGCTKETSTSNLTTLDSLIYNKDKVNAVLIFKGQEGTPSKTISNDTEVMEFIKQIKELEAKQLSKGEDIAFMKKGEKLKEKGILQIKFVEEYPFNSLTSGQILAWPDGTIYITDMKTMTGSKRTVSYITTSKHPKFYDYIMGKTNPHHIDASKDNDKADPQNVHEGYKVLYSFLEQKNFDSITNSAANAVIKLPTDFNAIKNGIKIGEILKHRNQLSKQNNYDFSSYLGKKVSIYTAAIKSANNDTFDVVLLLSENKIIGYWIDYGKKDSKHNMTDFILLVKLLG
ncbi:MAG: DUF4830 domain-containing protein [Firmicutes bacterium]|nr:DUF4830 domain-containing protein [Bacillota bacterium]